MDSKTPDLMQMLTGQMRYMAQRQKVIAQNVANVDTPGYKAQDLKKVDFSQMVEGESQKLAMTTTSPKHLSGIGGGGTGTTFPMMETKSPDLKPTKNDVVLEDEMAKISDTGTQYDMASSLYKKFTALYRTALGK